jgi:putative salt-induced outer membrane protein YdiY
VFECGRLPADAAPPDWAWLAQELKSRGLNPFAVQNASDELAAAAAQAGLLVLNTAAPAPAAEPEAAAAPAPAAAAPAGAAWNGTIGLGLVSLTGNSRSVTFNTNAAAERKTEGWILGTKLYATYGQNRAAAADAPTETVAEAAGLQLRVDRRFGPRYSTYALAAADADHVKSVELRSTGELGASVLWVDAGGDSGWKTSLRTDLGFRLSDERRYEYYPADPLVAPHGVDGVTLYAPRAGLAFKYAMSKDVLFSEDAEVMPNVSGDSRVLVNSISKISTRLSRTLAFGVAFTVNHDSSPAPAKVATDTALALTLDVLL